MSSTTNFYRNSAQPVSTNTGNNAQSINNVEGANTMDTQNTEYTDEEQRIIDGIKDVDVTSSNTGSSPALPNEILAGDYLATITDVHQKTHASGYIMIIANMVVADGDFTGFPLTKFYHLKSQKPLDFFKKEMQLIGFPVKGEDDLPNLLSALPKTSVMTNVVFNESGNRIIYLKATSAPKKVASVAPKLNW